MVGKIPGTDVHWGFAVGVLLSIALYILMTRTTFGFAARVTGGNFRAALAQGLPVGRLIVSCAMIAGGCAGLAGFFEVAAIQGRANASLAAGYGFTGILVSFLARHNPLVIVPVAILFGGLVASGGLIQRRMGLPDATVLVLAGPDLRRAADLGDALRALCDLQPDEANGPDMNAALATVLIAMLGGAIRVSTPFMFVALGECLTEKSGRVNLGQEGTLVLGAMVAYAISYHTGSPWVGVLAAGVAGSVLGAMHGSICKLPKVNDVAVGIAMMLFGTGVAFFFGKPYIQPTAPRLPSMPFGGWSDRPQPPKRARHQPAVLRRHRHRPPDGLGACATRAGAWSCAPSATARRRRGRWAFRSISCASSPTTVGGFLAGIGGAFLSLSYPGSWNQGLSSGQGLMAVALVIFARWSPMRCVLAALLFGGAGAIGPALQSVGITQGYYFFNAAPYILTLIIMIATSSAKRSARDMPGELSMVR